MKTHTRTQLIQKTQKKIFCQLAPSKFNKANYYKMATEADARDLAEKDYYFNSYSHYGIHMEMLKDRSRTESYRDAIYRNAYMFKGKTVLDVGCGTGILSMFCAKAGAKKVIGIDCSSIANQAREIVKENGYADVITIIQGKIEDLKELPDGIKSVDIIVSEWMGYFLLYESMLQTVLYARDRFGNKSGVKLLPDTATMGVVGITDHEYVQSRFDVWKDVQGIDFGHFRRLQLVEPIVDTCAPAQCCTSAAELFHFRLNDVKEEDLDWSSDFKLTANKNEIVHALCVYFNTGFTAGHEEVVLDTSPWAMQGHWRQTVLYLNNPLRMEHNEVANFRMRSKPNSSNPRDLDITLRVDFDGVCQSSHFDQDFRLR